MSDEDVSLSALALVHEREMVELGTAAGDLAKLAVLHDKELEAVRAALPVAFKELGAHLGDQLSDLTTRHAERTQALLLTKQGVIAHELGLTATREVASRIGAVREELSKHSETSLARLIVAHQSKLGEFRPLMTELAREEAERVTKHALTGLPDVKDIFRKELAALPNVGMQLVRANKGNWKPTEIYNAGDIIFFRGSSYLVLRQTKRGEFPTPANQNKPTATFQILAAAGAPGMSPLSTELDSKLTAVSVASANGFAGTSSGGTTPILTLSTTVTGIIKGDGTALSAAVAGDFPTLNQNTTGSAAKWTTARNLAGNSVDGSANVAFTNKFIVQGTTDAGLTGAQFLGALGTGIVKNTTTTGVLSVAVAGDFPTLNQNTTGSAATLTTPRAIYGNNFDGSAALTQIIASTFGGTGNGFTKFAGPATAERTFTLPNQDATLLYSGGALGTPSSGTATNLTGSSGITGTGVLTSGSINWTGNIQTTGNIVGGAFYVPDNSIYAFGPVGGTDTYIAGNNSTNSFSNVCGGITVGSFSTTGLALTGVISTTDPAGGAGPGWKLGVAASVSPTAPNRTVRIDIAGTSYYLAAKTTND